MREKQKYLLLPMWIKVMHQLLVNILDTLEELKYNVFHNLDRAPVWEDSQYWIIRWWSETRRVYRWCLHTCQIWHTSLIRGNTHQRLQVSHKVTVHSSTYTSCWNSLLWETPYAHQLENWTPILFWKIQNAHHLLWWDWTHRFKQTKYNSLYSTF